MRQDGVMLDKAIQAYKKGNLALAECLCQDLLDKQSLQPLGYILLGKIALDIGEPQFAIDYFNQVPEQDQNYALAQNNALAAHEIISKKNNNTDKKKSPKYLLVKAWGCGFWSDVDHVLGQLLLAEMTERIPIVYWGKNSLFGDPESVNSFEIYFEPVSSCLTFELLKKKSFTFYPGKWSAPTLLLENVNKFSGKFSRMAGIYGLNRREDVLVSDFHSFVYELMPWIRSGSLPVDGGYEEIYRYLFKKYIKLKPHLTSAIENFWGAHMQGKKILAVHVRGSDKVTEQPQLNEFNLRYFDAISKVTSIHNDIYIFIITDSEPVLEDYKKRFGEKLIYTHCTRSTTDVGVHYQGHPGSKIGAEIILDTYLAAKCDFFIGNGASNVSTTIGHMKDWPDGRYILLGDNILFQRNLFLHDC